MSRSPTILFSTIFVCLLATGCQLDTPVLQRGGNGRMGVLLNYSCGAQPCDPIDPAKPTIVFTHGWNPAPKLIHTTFAQSAAREVRCRCGDSYNLLSWDWNGVKVKLSNDVETGRCQGRKMASALRARGVNPAQTQIVAHSLGTVAASQAALCLSDLGPLAQLTLLDPPENYHEEIFCKLRATKHARCVENYWAPGISGFGAPVNCRGVRNYRVAGATPMRGVPDLSSSNHVHVMLWYYKTTRCPQMKHGFQCSCLRSYCGRQAAPIAENPIPPDTRETLPVAATTIACQSEPALVLPAALYMADRSTGSRKR